MAITDKIEIDFHLFGTGDPKVLGIIDTSVWSYIENKPAIIEIVPPNTEKTITYNYLKNKTNVFNSSNLLLSPIGVYNDLSDGIYKVNVKGSPSSFFKQRDILKTDKTKLELYKLYSSVSFDKNSKESEILSKIKEVKFLIESAEALTSIGESYAGLRDLQSAMKLLKDYNNCKDCK